MLVKMERREILVVEMVVAQAQRVEMVDILGEAEVEAEQQMVLAEKVHVER